MPGPVPAPGRFGLGELGVPELGREVVAAWDAFLDGVRDPSTDLSRPSRLSGWTGRETCIHLGNWDDSQVLEGILASARTGALKEPPPPDRVSDLLVRAHREATDEDVVGALVQARERIAHFFAGGEAEETGRLLAGSAVGPLPVLSLVHAGTYELAVHTLDLAPCGAPPPAPVLLDRGLAALVDVTGALTARAGIDVAITAMTADGGWSCTSQAHSWSTGRVAAGPFDGVGVRGSAVDLLDVSAGRAGLPQLLVSRRLQVQQLPQWMRLAPLLDDVPGLPGGAALRAAVGGVSGVAGRVGRLLGQFRG
ncbi:MAG: maleylpyruvate isomerase N-terminal domain-containing protein [Mycobacteriales bacterium]